MKRIYHTWEKWECYPAGFYETLPPNGMTPAEATALYAEFLRDSERFNAALWRVITEWPKSSEHYLSNEKMNRIAWLGQAAMCIETRVPSAYRGGFNRLTSAEQEQAIYVPGWKTKTALEIIGELLTVLACKEAYARDRNTRAGI